MKILITGSNGFIGKNLCTVLKEFYPVEAPDRKTLDLLDTEAVEVYLRVHGFDVIIHAANINTTRNAGVSPYDSLDGNLRMFFNLERCRSYYGKMYYFGSGAEYDMRHYIPYMQESYFGTFIPKDPYGFSKFIMSKACREDRNIYDLRLFGVYGKYEEWTRRFISNAICRALKGMDITIRQNAYFDYLWVEDLCNIMKWFVENKPRYRHYNVCRGMRTDLYSIACMVRDTLGMNCNIIVSQSGWKPEYTGDNKRLLEEIGGYSFTGFDKTLLLLCEFYKKNIDMVDEKKLV